MINQLIHIRENSKDFKTFNRICLNSANVKYIEFLKKMPEMQFLFENYEHSSIRGVQINWHFFNKIFEVQMCDCGKPLKLIHESKLLTSSNVIYYSHCGEMSCRKSKTHKTNLEKYGNISPLGNDAVRKKSIKTCNERYGVDYPLLNKSIKIKSENTVFKKHGVGHYSKTKEFSDKFKNTMNERYGVSHPLQSPEILNRCKNTCIKNNGIFPPSKSEDIKSKIRDTNILRYLVDNPMKLNKFVEKSKQKCIEKYGVDSFSKTDEFKEKIIISSIKKYGVSNPSLDLGVKNKIKNSNNNNFINKLKQEFLIEFVSFKDGIITLKCDKCGNEFSEEYTFIYQRKYLGLELCTYCNPYKTKSQTENKLTDFIRILNDDILSSDREILQGKEIDIYIPSLKIGFEFNGIFWHSDKFKSKYYHQQKKYQALEQGVNLIHIWEDDWEFKCEIVEARIKNVLGITENKIFARKCSIVEVTASDSKAFLEQNHIQGQVGAKRRLGLIYEGNLVSLMTFGMRNGKMEMLRFCNKLNYSVVGGFSKLLKYFKKDFAGEIYSYADLDWSNPNDNVYIKNGFTLVKKTEPGYFWVKNDKRYARQQFQKHKLIKQGFDPSKTEEQIMIERGYLKIYNSGNLLYMYK